MTNILVCWGIFSQLYTICLDCQSNSQRYKFKGVTSCDFLLSFQKTFQNNTFRASILSTNYRFARQLFLWVHKVHVCAEEHRQQCLINHSPFYSAVLSLYLARLQIKIHQKTQKTKVRRVKNAFCDETAISCQHEQQISLYCFYCNNSYMLLHHCRVETICFMLSCCSFTMSKPKKTECLGR